VLSRHALLLAWEFIRLRRNFEQYFEVVPATTPELTDAAHRVRHQVYCRELGWEPVRPDGRETDAYDPYSLHCLLRSVRTGEDVGCVRIIRAKPDEPAFLLPFERACANTLDRSIIDPQKLPRATIAEVSRLAVIGKYRRRQGEQQQRVAMSDADYGTFRQPRFPYVPVGLYLGMLEMARLHTIDTLFILTEPWLAAHFGRLGVKMRQIGGPIEHRGLRVPSVMHVSEITRRMSFFIRPLYRSIAAKVQAAYARAPRPL